MDYITNIFIGLGHSCRNYFSQVHDIIITNDIQDLHMQDLIIPGWAVIIISVLGGGLVGWLVWLTTKTFENQRMIDVNSANDKNVSVEIEKIYKSVERLEGKLDKFLSNEMDFLKQMLKKQP